MLLGLIDKLSGEKTRLLGLIHATVLEKGGKKRVCREQFINCLGENIFAGTNSLNCLREETCLMGLIHKLFWRQNVLTRTVHRVFERKHFCWD